MSRNKTIKAMHEMTGLKYSECRRKLKANHWDIYSAMGFNNLFDKLQEFSFVLRDELLDAVKAVVDAAYEVAEKLMISISEVDWEKVKEYADELNRQNSIEALPMEIPGETAGAETGDDFS